MELPTPITDGAVTVEARASRPPCPDAAATVSVTIVLPVNFYFTALALERGQTFRTVDATYSYGADTLSAAGTAYYLLLRPDLPAPSAETVISFDDPIALADGTAARGQFPVVFGAGQTDQRALLGREAPAPYPDETGAVDGYRYALYMVAVLDGKSSAVTSPATSAIGMPFQDGNGDAAFPFGIQEITPAEMTQWPDLLPRHPINRAGVMETARMLDNIEGMVVLFENTDGLYVLEDTLSDVYLLQTDFDLSCYVPAYSGAGWRPIGNVNASLFSGGTPHVFTGQLQTGGLKTITGLPISQTPENTGVVSYAGCSGQL